MMSHTLEKARHLDSTQPTLEEVIAFLQGGTLDEFGEVLMQMPSEQLPNLSRVLPPMASEDIQREWTGNSGKTLLGQSVSFISAITNEYERLSRRAIRDARVLDFGCGWGRLLRLMLYFVPPSRIFGCDAWDTSLKMIRDARIPVRLEKSDALPQTLPFGDTKMDLIYAFSIFTHLSEAGTRACLGAFRRSLAPEGICVITIRPPEYWEMTKSSRPEAATAELLAAHHDAGFAYSPSETDSLYGDTSISPAYLRREFPEWKILKMGHVLIDPLQIYVYLRPTGRSLC